jgi:hypothetical protein
MALDWKWIGMSAALTLGILAGPLLASAADSSRRSYSAYTPSAPTPPVKPQFNNAAAAPPKPRPSNASGSALRAALRTASPMPRGPTSLARRHPTCLRQSQTLRRRR